MKKIRQYALVTAACLLVASCGLFSGTELGSEDASLVVLKAGGVILQAGLDGSYSLDLPNAASGLALELALPSGASVLVSLPEGSSASVADAASASAAISALPVGTTRVTIAVTAEDGSTVKEYTLVLKRMPSSDASIESLKVNGVELLFDEEGRSYSATIPSDYGEASVSLVLSLPLGAKARIDEKIEGTSASLPAPEWNAPGECPILVTSEKGDESSYSLLISRAAPGAPLLQGPSSGKEVATPKPQFSWSEPSGLGGKSVGYEVRVWIGRDSSTTPLFASARVEGASWSIAESLAAGQEYSWRVDAYNEQNGLLVRSALGIFSTIALPAAPTNIRALKSGVASYLVSWDAVPGALRYRLFKNDGASPIALPENPVYVDSDFSVAIVKYSLKAENAFGEGAAAEYLLPASLVGSGAVIIIQ
jgi:hypothetical protein